MLGRVHAKHAKEGAKYAKVTGKQAEGAKASVIQCSFFTGLETGSVLGVVRRLTPSGEVVLAQLKRMLPDDCQVMTYNFI